MQFEPTPLADALVSPEDILRVMLERLLTQDVYCLDLEASGLDFRHNFIAGYAIAFSPDPLDAYYLPVRHFGFANLDGREGPRNETAWDETVSAGERELLETLDRKGLLMFGHNLAFDLKFLARTGHFKFRPRCEDTIINAPLLNEHQRSFSLESCANIAGVAAKKHDVIIQHICNTFPEAAKKPKSAMGWFWRLPGDDPVAHEYGCGDVTTTWQLRDWQNVQLREQDLLKVHDVESRLIRVLAKMSYRGVKVDEQRLAEVITLVETEIEELKSRLPKDLNPRSPLQMKAYCEANGHTDWPLTPTGKPSFPESWLSTHEAGRRVVEVRKLTTLLASFLLPLRDKHLWRGRVHPTFNQLRNDEFGTVTGRLSCNDPNLQQVPKRDKKLAKLIRSVFIPDDGMVWASADYSQMEPRLLAHYSQSRVLIKGYTSDPPVDAHQAVADAAHIDRETGKRVNQTLITGGGKGVLTTRYDIPADEVNRVWNDYFRAMPEIKTLQKKAALKFRQRGYVISLLGRRARLNDDRDYTAVNRLLQCGNADAIKLKMVEIDEYLEEQGCRMSMINNVHDDICYQFPEDEREFFNECIRIQTAFGPGDVIELSVPVLADPGEGPNWAVATYGEEK